MSDSDNRTHTVTSRVTPRTRRLAEAAAELRGSTLSAFVAEAVRDAARRELMPDSTEPGKKTILAAQSFNAT